MITRALTSTTLAVMTILSLTSPVYAQAAPVWVVGNSDPKNQYYQAQQYLHETQSAWADYQQFKIAYDNYTKYHVGSLVDVAGPLMDMETQINAAMNKGQDPHLAAEMRRNKFILQDLHSIDQVKAIVDDPNSGNAKMQQALSLLMLSLYSNNAQQSETEYAQAQDEIRRDSNLSRIANANASSTVVP